MKESDNLLVDLKKEETDAYQRLFYTFFTDLVCYACNFLKNRELAEDLVQELFITFWTEKKYRYIQTGLEGYLFRSVRNGCLNYLRDERRKNNKLPEVMAMLLEEAASEKNESEMEKEREVIYRAIHRLPEQCKKIFILCCFEGLKYQEAADRLNISINTVRTQMGRAFKFLRDTLSEEHFSALLLFLFRKCG